jgi:NAD(P)-dependent dehydrogenase (short-subunit alcohol dehydrogenase family)
MNTRFTKQKVLVTGASDGMGRAVSRLFGREGARVLAVGRSPEKLADTSNGFSDIIPFSQDLADDNAARLIVEKAAELLGGIDILVNCAGVFDMVPLADVTIEHLQSQLAVNFYAPAMLSVLAIPYLQKSEAGRIINISTIAAHYVDTGMGGYVASKSALEGFTKCLALELGPYGVTANLICPGMIRTGMTEGFLQDPAVVEHFTSRVPAGRVGSPQEIAEAVAYLASADAGFCTGTIMRMDGGYSLGAQNSNWAS